MIQCIILMTQSFYFYLELISRNLESCWINPDLDLNRKSVFTIQIWFDLKRLEMGFSGYRSNWNTQRKTRRLSDNCDMLGTHFLGIFLVRSSSCVLPVTCKLVLSVSLEFRSILSWLVSYISSYRERFSFMVLSYFYLQS